MPLKRDPGRLARSPNNVRTRTSPSGAECRATPPPSGGARGWLLEPDDFPTFALPLSEPRHLARDLGPGSRGAPLHLPREECLHALVVPLEHEELPAAEHGALATMVRREPGGRHDEQSEPLPSTEAKRADLQNERDREVVRVRWLPARKVRDLVTGERFQASSH